ncbi:unnamed protein product, partial [Closterium sp. Naga37s-1]
GLHRAKEEIGCQRAALPYALPDRHRFSQPTIQQQPRRRSSMEPFAPLYELPRETHPRHRAEKVFPRDRVESLLEVHQKQVPIRVFALRRVNDVRNQRNPVSQPSP